MSQTSKKAKELLEAIQKQNLQLELQLRGAGALPEGYQSTYLQPTGPQGFGEGLLNTLGLYKDTKAEALLPQAQANYASLSQAVTDLTEQQAEEAKVKNREEDSYSTQKTIDTIKELGLSLGQQNLDLIREQGRVTTQQNINQARALFPLLDEAGRRGTERALDASQRYRAFKEQLPSSIQAIMASKQAQLASASNAFAAEAQAIANQQQAATGFAQSGLGKYAGRRIA